MTKTTRTISAVFFMMVPLWAHAAGFDCNKASTAVEKAICTSPGVSALDGKLGEAFTTALKNHPAKADVLKLDQRHWLAGRDEAVAGFLTDNAGKPLTGDVAQYQQRIDFLRGLDTKAPKPLDVVEGSLSRLPAGSYDVLGDLAKAGANIALATTVAVPAAKAFPYLPDEPLRKALAGVDASSGYRSLPGMPVSSLFSVGGTASCWTETPFRIEGKKAVSVKAPGAWSPDCLTRHGMARIGSDFVATMLVNPSPNEMDIEVSPWQRSAFGPDAQLTMRFDHALVPAESACAPKESPCDDFTTTAMTAVARYDRSPIQGTLDRPLKGAEKTAYNAMLEAARAPSGIAPKSDAVSHPEPPMFSGTIASGLLQSYGPDATFFPISFRGESLLGFIGHGHVGWRQNSDWMVSAWRLKGGKLEPVARVYVNVKRGSLLLSSIVPAPVPVPMEGQR